MCWYCYWGLPKPVADIFHSAIALLGRNEPLLYGPAHVVWGDHNLEDSSIYFCLGECDRDGHWDYDAATIDIVRQSLKQLLEIPEDLPVEDFPPPAGMVMVKKYRGVPVWPRPIPVSERLPEPDAECLFFDEYSGWWMNSWDDIPKSTRPKITHWLPLPPKP